MEVAGVLWGGGDDATCRRGDQCQHRLMDAVL